MKEDIFVIKDGQEHRLDLVSPSGITITYNSNIFNDLSKIDSSKSYTFKIPNTANNSAIFDMIEEIAHASSMYGKKMACRYFYNGIEICKNANLYISEVSSSGDYSAVMTWDAIEGLIEMNDNDLSLQSLEDYQVAADYGEGEISRNRFKLANFISADEVVYPYYSAGVPFDMDTTSGMWRDTLIPMCPPAVPIYKILKKIENKYGLTFNFKKQCDYHDLLDDVQNFKVDLLKHGVLPLIKTEMSETLQGQNKCSITSINLEQYGDLYGVENVLSFSGGSVVGTYITRHTGRGTCGFQTHVPMMSLSFDGFVKVGFEYRYGEGSSEVPKLIFSSARIPRTESDPVVFDDEDPEEKATVEGEFVGIENGCQMYLFDFRSSNGMANVVAENLKTYDFYKRVLVISTNYPVKSGCVPTANFTMKAIFDEGIIGHKCDIFSNLPNISCLTFLKSLFYMVGGFPRVESNGSLSISYFNDLQTNRADGNVLDWSNKYLGHSESTHKTSFTNGNLAVNNYYLMANDKLDEQEDLTKDQYEHSFALLECENYSLERRKTIYQMPYYGKYKRSAKSPRLSTGNTIKYFEKSKGEVSAQEAQPAFGLLSEYIYGTDEILTMSVWQFPTRMANDDSYSYLQKIVKKPYVVEVELNLTELDLMNLDYRKPIYIKRFNLYFAIVKIQFTSSTGISKATLIKLPN